MYVPGLFHLGRGVGEEEKAYVNNVASLKMTDGYVYHRINFISKTLLPPIEK